MNKNSPIAIAASALLLAGCATNVRKPTASHNPAPAQAFSHYNAFSLKPINTGESCDKQRGADVALRTIVEKLNGRIGSMIATWNSKTSGAAKRTLVLEPVCSDAKLVGSTARALTGALAGSSAIVMKMRYIDQATGKIIAEPVFYQRANAMGAAWSFGATDRDMLERIVELMANYTEKNYSAAVGGPTGLEM